MQRQQQLAGVEFTNLNSGMPVSEVGESILGYSHARVRVHFKPRSAGQFSTIVEVVNLNDASNVERFGVHAFVTAHPQEEGLLLSGVLDFGDCYTSVPTRQLLSVRNISEHHLDVHLSSDVADEVSFDMYTEVQTKNAAADGGEGGEGEGESEGEGEGEGEGGGAVVALDQEEDEGEGGGASSRMRRIEELALAPGRERAVYVCYRPSAHAKDENKKDGGLQPTRLARRVFRVDLKGRPSQLRDLQEPTRQNSGGRGSVQYARCVQCRARVCTSVVKVSPTRYDFGDCGIQSQKRATALVRNLSELPAVVSISFNSKVLSLAVPQRVVTIAPRQAHELRFDFVPRRVNPAYRKQVTITNLKNEGDEHLVEFVANNVDRHNISFHSLFYTLALLAPPPSGRAPAAAAGLAELRAMPPDQCHLAFEDVVARCMQVRALSVRNISGKPVKLRLSCSSSSAQLAVYKQGDPQSSASRVSPVGQRPGAKLEHLMERLEESRGAPPTRGGGTMTSFTLEDSAAPRRAAPTAGATPDVSSLRLMRSGGVTGVAIPSAAPPFKPRARDPSVGSGAAASKASGVEHLLLDSRAALMRQQQPPAGALAGGLLAPRGAGGVPASRSHDGHDGKALPWTNALRAGAPGERAGLVPTQELTRRSSTPNVSTTAKLELEQVARPGGARPGPGGGGAEHAGRRAAEQRLFSAQMVAVAGCFRDLTTSPLQVAAAHRAIAGRGRATDRETLRQMLEAWAGGGVVPGAAPANIEEEGLVRVHKWLRETVDDWKRSGLLVPVASSAAAGEVTLLAEEECVLLVEILPEPPAAPPAPPDGANGRSAAASLRQVLHRKVRLEGAISLELVEFDSDVRNQHQQRLQRLLPSGQVPPQPQMSRALPLLGWACTSVMQISQRSINFGSREVKSRTEKTLVIDNRSALPLLYKVSKSGKHASFDLQITREDRLGCVRPFGSRQIRFIFSPSLAGPFRETLTVLNAQDASDQQEVVVKAEVRKVVSFHLNAPPLDFGPCLLGRPAGVTRRLVLSNLARGTRQYQLLCAGELTLQADGAPCAAYKARLELVLEGAAAEGAEQLVEHERAKEEKLEVYERKLRIATRKGKVDKAEKIRSKIAALRAGDGAAASDSEASDWGGNSESENDEPSYGAGGRQRGAHGRGAPRPGSPDSARRGTLNLRLGPNATQTVALQLTIVPADRGAMRPPPPTSELSVVGTLSVSEHRNKDSARELNFYAVVYSEAEQLRRLQVSLNEDDGISNLPRPDRFIQASPARQALAASKASSPPASKASKPLDSLDEGLPRTLASQKSIDPERLLQVREALSGKSSPDRSLSPATSPTLSPTTSLRGDRDTVDGSCSPTASPTAVAAPERLALDRHVGAAFDSPTQRADAPTDSSPTLSPDTLSHDTLSPMLPHVPRGASATLRPIRNGGVVQQLAFCKGASGNDADGPGAGGAGASTDRASGPLATSALASGTDAGSSLRPGSSADTDSANGDAGDPGGSSAASPPAPPSRYALKPSPLRLPNAFGLGAAECVERQQVLGAALAAGTPEELALEQPAASYRVEAAFADAATVAAAGLKGEGGAADARLLGTLAVSQAAPVRMVLHSHSDDELPLRLFWSPVPPRLGGSHHAHLRQPWLGAAAETGHAVLLSLEGVAPADAMGVPTAVAASELVEGLDVLLPPRGSVVILAQVAATDDKRADDKRGGGGNGGGGNGGGGRRAAARAHRAHCVGAAHRGRDAAARACGAIDLAATRCTRRCAEARAARARLWQRAHRRRRGAARAVLHHLQRARERGQLHADAAQRGALRRVGQEVGRGEQRRRARRNRHAQGGARTVGRAALAAPPQRLHPARGVVRGRGALRGAATGQPAVRCGRAQSERRRQRAGPAAAHPRARRAPAAPALPRPGGRPLQARAQLRPLLHRRLRRRLGPGSRCACGRCACGGGAARGLRRQRRAAPVRAQAAVSHRQLAARAAPPVRHVQLGEAGLHLPRRGVLATRHRRDAARRDDAHRVGLPAAAPVARG